MEHLKKILSLALQSQAMRIKLQHGRPVELITSQGPVMHDTGHAIDHAYLLGLFSFLFPNDQAAVQAQQMAKGWLNIPNLGKIALIGQPAPPASLRLYLPPAGNALFEADWARLNGRTVMPPSSMPPVPASMRAPMPAFSPAVPPPQPMPAAPPAAGRTVPASRSGFIPSGFEPSGGMPPSQQGGGVKLPVSASPAALSDTGPRPAPSGGGFVPSGLLPGGEAAVALGTIAAEPSARGLHPAQIVHPAPVAAPPAAAQVYPAFAAAPGPAVRPAPHAAINFGADAVGEADISDGQNPIDPLLTDMIKRRASDLHMTCGEPICLRIDGDIVRITDGAADADQVASLLLPIMPQRNQDEFVSINDTDFAYEIRGVGRFRVNIFRDRNGVGAVMRHIPSTILTAEQLGLPPAITKFCNLSKGLVLVTGPTGSGKSTTLAAMIDLINKTRADHILTIEDPIEFVHRQQRSLINQREVHKHTGSFARALKAALREDPDIVLIGEMRDLETIAIAIETAETGHLVFGTLHTTTAVSTVERIVDQFPTDRQEQVRMMLSSSLRGVVAQTLLKKKGGGRVAAHEILVTNDAVSAMVREGKNHMIPNHMQTQKADGNILLNESLLRLVKEGLVDPEEAIRKAIDKANLTDALKRSGVKLDAPPPPAPGRPPGRQAS